MKLLIIVLAMVMSSTPFPALATSPATKTIQTPDGPVTTTTTNVDPTHQDIVLASAQQRAELDALATQATGFLKTYLPGRAEPSLVNLDMAFSVWQQTKDPIYTEHQVIEILGAYLGKKLADDFQMNWVIVIDQYGRDFGVRGRKHEIMAFPFASVVKRIEKKQHDFMVGVYYAVRDTSMSGKAKLR